MFVKLVDHNGNEVAVDPDRVIKLRRALLSDEPKNTVFVDYATNGLFAQGTFDEICALFSPHIRLAFLHAPTGADVALNANGIASVQVSPKNNKGQPIYRGNSVAVVDRDHFNERVPARNMIALRETVKEAQEILEKARA